jgi:hypothetical protein
MIQACDWTGTDKAYIKNFGGNPLGKDSFRKLGRRWVFTLRSIVQILYML